MTMTLGIQRPDTKAEVILGVDTHLDFHVAVAVDHLGREAWASRACQRARTITRGYSVLGGGLGLREVRWDRTDQQLRGLKLARHLRVAGISVVEVERPKRRHLRRNGKSDPLDAEAAARAQCWPARLSESLRAATDEWR